MRSGCLLLPFSAQFCREPLGRRDACLGIMKAEAWCRKVVALNIAAHECSQFYHLDAAVACACGYDRLTLCRDRRGNAKAVMRHCHPERSKAATFAVAALAASDRRIAWKCRRASSGRLSLSAACPPRL